MEKIIGVSKRILIVGQHFWPESFRVNDIADYFVEQGCEVDVLCGKPNYPSGQFSEGYSFWSKIKEEHKGITIYRAPEIPRGSNTNIRILLNYISFPVFSLFFIPFLLTKKYDKIFLYQLSPVMMSFAGIMIGKIKRVETTMYVLDLWPENLFSVIDIMNKFLRKLVTTISHWHYRSVDKLIVLSDRMKLQLQKVTAKPDNQVIVLPQACEKLYEQDVRDKKLEERFSGGFNIVFAGNISPAQSFETIIDAAKILKKEGLKDIRWIIVGDGMSRKWLEEKVAKADLSESFYFEGFRPMEDIPKYTGTADALVGCLVKSDLLEATIPAKVMSYIASGKPLLLAMDGEVQTLVNNTIQCGLVGPTGDARALADNTRLIYNLSQHERDTMGRKGRLYHLKHFERNLILDKLYNFILR